MFNIADIVVVILLLIALFRGYKRGFIKTGFGVLSFFIAISITFAFYKPVMNFIKDETGFEEWLSEYLYSMNFNENDNSNIESGELIQTTNAENGEEFLNNLPQNIVGMLNLEDIKANAKTAIVEKIVDFVVKLLAIIIVYIVAKIILWIIVLILDSIAKLPILKQFNEVLGLVLGCILGVIQIYTICAVITLVGSLPAMERVLALINNSVLASNFYNNNLLLEILF